MSSPVPSVTGDNRTRCACSGEGRNKRPCGWHFSLMPRSEQMRTLGRLRIRRSA